MEKFGYFMHSAVNYENVCVLCTSYNKRTRNFSVANYKNVLKIDIGVCSIRIFWHNYITGAMADTTCQMHIAKPAQVVIASVCDGCKIHATTIM